MLSIFSNSEILEERASSDDLLNSTTEIDRVKKRILSTIKNNKSIIIAYLGAFGVGKSTILKSVEKDLTSKSKNEWVTFETWRYANRNELWDAFVIKLVSEISNKKEVEVARDIDGSRIKPLVALMWIAIATLTLSSISYILYNLFSGDGGFVEAYLKYALPVIVPILLLIGLSNFLNSLSYGEPLKRTFQLEEMLRKSLSSIQKPLIVVIEDVDRANDDASIFMESLQEFINKKASKFEYPVVIIAPQSNSAFDALESDRKKRIEHSLKVYDEKMYFNSDVGHATVDEFYKRLPFNEQYEKYKPTMTEITKEVNYYFKNDQFTIRMLKHALREVDWFIQAYPDHSPSVALVYALARMLREGENILAVRGLGSGKNLERHNTDGKTKFIIKRKNVFIACLAVAAGAEGTGVLTEFLTPEGKFNQLSMYENIVVESSKDGEQINKDEVEHGGISSHQYNSKQLKVYVRRTYSEQLMI